eukprot:1362994-Amorphochlora_amoeboformis.AAC.3
MALAHAEALNLNSIAAVALEAWEAEMRGTEGHRDTGTGGQWTHGQRDRGTNTTVACSTKVWRYEAWYCTVHLVHLHLR